MSKDGRNLLHRTKNSLPPDASLTHARLHRGAATAPRGEGTRLHGHEVALQADELRVAWAKDELALVQRRISRIVRFWLRPRFSNS